MQQNLSCVQKYHRVSQQMVLEGSLGIGETKVVNKGIKLCPGSAWSLPKAFQPAPCGPLASQNTPSPLFMYGLVCYCKIEVQSQHSPHCSNEVAKPPFFLTITACGTTKFHTPFGGRMGEYVLFTPGTGAAGGSERQKAL